MSEDTRTEKELFIDSLVDNENRLARAIEEGQTVEEVRESLGFDESQYQTMKDRLATFEVVDEGAEADTATDTASSEGGDTTTVAAEGEAEKTTDDVASVSEAATDTAEGAGAEAEKGEGALAEGAEASTEVKTEE